MRSALLCGIALLLIATGIHAQDSAPSAAPDIFVPIPFTSMSAAQMQAVKDAHEKRVQFVTDTSFSYVSVLNLCKTSLKQASMLENQGNTRVALAKVREINRMRPIGDIPLVGLIGYYSALLGKTGNTQEQAKMQSLLYGILQDIAHSGDGLSKQTAVHVIAISEEYSWLSVKRLHLKKQDLLTDGSKHYDALSATDPSGQLQTYYFDISDFYTREGGH